MNIKITETADPLLLCRLNQEIQNLHAAMYPHIFKKFDENSIELAMRNIVSMPQSKCHIATLGSQIAGYMITIIREYPETAFTYGRKSLYIDQIAVLQSFRQKGVGKALLDYAYNMALYSGLRRIELDHWSNNTAAAKFFRKNGFNIYREMLKKDI